MKLADFSAEKSLWSKGLSRVCGLDEVGRGPLAGPVVACALVFDFSHKDFNLVKKKEFRDSKLFSPKQREKLFDFLTHCEAVKYGVSSVGEKAIDELNILQASQLAMRQALQQLSVLPELLLIDGRETLGNYPCNQKAVIKGDEKIASVAAASVIAKVLRDQKMREYHALYPQYGFDRHKGYGTRQHLAAIFKHGPCPVHRLSFAPLKHLDKTASEVII